MSEIVITEELVPMAHYQGRPVKKIVLTTYVDGEKLFRIWFEGCGSTLEEKRKMLCRDAERFENERH
jgi:hypothetical protein